MLELQGAYGRTYKSYKEARKDWEGGLDFKLVNGSYTSIRDFDKMKEMGSIKLIETYIYIKGVDNSW